MRFTERAARIGSLAAASVLAFAGTARAEVAGPVECGGPDGSCYQVFLYDVEDRVEEQVGWQVARAAANSKLRDGISGRLVTITSSEEDDLIRQLAVATFNQTGLPRAELWAGGFQSPFDVPEAEPDGNWQWINGEGLFLYTNWDNGEPNNLEGEEYLGIGLQGYSEDNYGWNDEQFLENIGGYVVEFGAWFPQENADVFPPSPETQITAVAEEVVQAGTFQQFSCVLKHPAYSLLTTNLVKEIRKTPGCEELAARLPDDYRAFLHPYQRGFATIVDDEGNIYDNTETVGTGPYAKTLARFVVTLVLTRDLDGQVADLTRGVLLSQEEAVSFLPAEPTCDTNFASDSPTTVGVTLSTKTKSGWLARNSTMTCNRTRSAVRYSDNLFAYPIRNVSQIADPWWQVFQEAADLRQTIGAELQTGCVNPAFLKSLRKQTDAAVAKSLSGDPVLEDQGIAGLQAATVFFLGASPDPTEGCPNQVRGEIGSRLLDLTFHVHRGLRYPDTYVLYEIPPEILELLPPFAGDVEID